MHVSVQTGPVVEYLQPQQDAWYLDWTCGFGGHSAAIARAGGRVIANDRDEQALRTAAERTAEWRERITFTHGPFSDLPERLRALGRTQFAGMVGDLGVNRSQLVTPERGFSFMSDGPLDMRMDQSRPGTAADLVNGLGEKALADLIYQFGEERRSRQIARAICRARPITTTGRLASVIRAAVPRTEQIDPSTRTFMALRIAVNDELDELKALLAQAPAMLAPGARIVLISFHSLEDRAVKHEFLEWARQGLGTVITKKPVTPDEEEKRSNPASRSAKLRCFERAGREMEQRRGGKRP